MAENTSTTLVPETANPDVITAPIPEKAPPISSESKALFDSIAYDPDPAEEGESSNTKAFFAGALWVGYAIAIVVALVLVWSAASGLLKSLPR